MLSLLKGKMMNRAGIIFVLFAGQFINISTAHAINKETHESVTTLAIKTYQDCTKQLKVKDTLTKGKGIIVESTRLEDESPLIKRYFNWHFYDAYNGKASEMGRSLTGARKSLHHIFNERADSLVEALEKNNKNHIYEFTGRLIHYIQDMTVPAHTAPIYHYKFMVDKSDYFDEMPEWRSRIFKPKANLCSSMNVKINELKNHFNTILNNTAIGTRNRIKAEILAKDGHRLKGKTWEEFWVLRNPDDDHKYSGTKSGFAPYGNQKKDGFKKLCEGTSSDKEICLSFFNQSFDSAISSTVKTLLLINAINLKN
jgi:hypothetical protein